MGQTIGKSFLFNIFEISECGSSEPIHCERHLRTPCGNLSVNEVTLVFRASISGTSKISSSMKVEDNNDINGVALEARTIR